MTHTSPANEIEELAGYISEASRVDQEVIDRLLWSIYHKAADYAIERIRESHRGTTITDLEKIVNNALGENS